MRTSFHVFYTDCTNTREVYMVHSYWNLIKVLFALRFSGCTHIQFKPDFDSVWGR